MTTMSGSAVPFAKIILLELTQLLRSTLAIRGPDIPVNRSRETWHDAIKYLSDIHGSAFTSSGVRGALQAHEN